MMERQVLVHCDVLPGPGLDFVAGAAIALEGSRIAWIGRQDDLPDAWQAVATRDLGGCLVIPGLINTHAHCGMSLQRGCCDDGDLFQWAAAIAPETSKLTVEDNRYGAEVAVMEMLRNGITTVCDCTRYGAGVLSDVASAFGMRSLSGALANSPSLRKAGRPNWPATLDETRAAMERHQGNPLVRHYLGAHSPYSCTEDLMAEVAAAAEVLGVPFVMHLAENRAEHDIAKERFGTTPLMLMHRMGLLRPGTILAHCVWLDDSEIDLLGASGAGVAHNPISNAKLANGVAPVPAMLRAGVPVGLGTDSSVSNNSLDVFQEMKFSVLLQRAATLDGYAMDAERAFAMATRGGARVLCWDDAIGLLTPGREADLVVMDLDHPLGRTGARALSDLVYRAGPQHVTEVMVAGKTLFSGNRFANVDADEVETRRKAFYRTEQTEGQPA